MAGRIDDVLRLRRVFRRLLPEDRAAADHGREAARIRQRRDAVQRGRRLGGALYGRQRAGEGVQGDGARDRRRVRVVRSWRSGGRGRGLRIAAVSGERRRARTNHVPGHPATGLLSSARGAPEAGARAVRRPHAPAGRVHQPARRNCRAGASRHGSRASSSSWPTTSVSSGPRGRSSASRCRGRSSRT